jgi:hypothetical protein
MSKYVPSSPNRPRPSAMTTQKPTTPTLKQVRFRIVSIGDFSETKVSDLTGREHSVAATQHHFVQPISSCVSGSTIINHFNNDDDDDDTVVDTSRSETTTAVASMTNDRNFEEDAVVMTPDHTAHYYYPTNARSLANTSARSSASTSSKLPSSTQNRSPGIVGNSDWFFMNSYDMLSCTPPISGTTLNVNSTSSGNEMMPMIPYYGQSATTAGSASAIVTSTESPTVPKVTLQARPNQNHLDFLYESSVIREGTNSETAQLNVSNYTDDEDDEMMWIDIET